MRITIDPASFAEAAVFAAKAISPRPPSPVMSGLLIEAVDSVLRLSGFDYETSNRVTVPADVEEPGHVLVPGRMLTDILTKLPKNKPVVLAVEGSRVTVTAGKSTYTLATMDANEFPTMPELPEVAGTVDGVWFAEAVAQVAGFASTEETLPIITGVRIEATGAQLRFLATDRYRLAEQVIDWVPNGGDRAWLVKARTLADVTKLVAGDLSILADGQTIGFRTGNRATTSLLIDGDYPRVGGLFPDTTAISVGVDRVRLADAVNRIATVTERDTAVRLQITDGEIELDAGNGDDATGREFVDCTLDGDPITVAYNPAFLESALKTFSAETVTISFTQPSKPSVITDGTDHRALLMPVRLK